MTKMTFKIFAQNRISDFNIQVTIGNESWAHYNCDNWIEPHRR